ncbi:MAG: hypothetical protein RR443_09575 [Anaerorhabdus sp.]|uniref:hypothetical protein n=1 Tax=Anaerorhabdus sp. TaxID=1872524 RepID=UPI002FCA344E
MKKIISFIATVVLCATFSITANAASGITPEEQQILDLLKAGVVVEGKTVTLDSSYLVQAENYLAQDGVSVTAAQKGEIVTQIEAAKKVVVDNKVTNLKTIDKKIQDQILVNAQAAGKVIGVTISADYASKVITVKDPNGKVILTASKTIKNTGDDYTSTLALSAAIALLLTGAGIFAVRKGLFVRG